MSKALRRLLPFLALAGALCVIWGIVLWWYDDFNRNRTLRMIYRIHRVS